MRLQDFRIGEEFLAHGERWRCTDIGTRVVAAIRVEYVGGQRFRRGDHQRRVIANRDRHGQPGHRHPPPRGAGGASGG